MDALDKLKAAGYDDAVLDADAVARATSCSSA